MMNQQNSIDFDTQIFLLEAEKEIGEYNKEEADRLNKNPEWWNIALGSIEASPAQYKKACEIKSKFLSFNPVGVGCFFERVKLFEQAMLEGRL